MPERISTELLMSEAIRAIGTPSFLPELLELMRGHAAFRGAFIVSLSKSAGPDHLYDNVREERRSIVVDRWLDAAWKLDPFVVAFRKRRNKSVCTLSDVAPDRFSSSEYFHTYYRSVRLRDELGMFVDLPDRTLFLSLGRLVGERRFSRHDVEKLSRIRPVVDALCQQHFVRQTFGRFTPKELTSTGATFLNDLTEREREVVDLILQGHSTNSIAATLDVSPATIKVHRKNLYRKLEISSQGELFALYLQPSTANP